MNKITKLLSVFVIAGAVGASVAGVAGCKGNDGGGDEGGHTHNYTQCAPDTEHPGKHILTCEGCEAGTEGHTKTEDCVDAKINDTGTAGEDGLCDKCGADMPGESEDPSKVKTITISTEDGKTANVECKAGKSIQLKATVAPGTATEQGVTWSLHADSESKATITQEGLLTIKSDLAADSSVTVYATTKEAGSSIKGTLNVKALLATEYDRLSALESNIIAKDFGTEETISKFSGTYGTKGLYVYGDNKALAEGSTGAINVSGGVAVHAPQSGENLSLLVDLGTVSDVIEGYVEWNPSAMGSKWPIIQLIGTSDNKTEVGTVFSVYTKDSNGNLGYALDGKHFEDGIAYDTKDAVSVPTGVASKIYFKISTTTGLITVKIGDKFVCENASTTINSVKALAFVSSSSGSRKVTFDNLAVNTYATNVTDVKAELKLKLDAYVEKATVDVPNAGEDTLTLTGEGVTIVVANVKTAIDEATTINEAKAAYVLTEVNNAILTQAKASANAILTDYRSDELFTHEGSNKDAMEKAKADGATAIEQAETVDAVRAALKAAKEECAKVLTDDEDNAAKVDITIKLNDDSGETAGSILQSVSGQAISVEDLTKALTVSTYLKNIKFYTDAAHSPESEITSTGYTPSASDTTATLYVVITDMDNTGTFTFTVGGVKGDANNPLAPAYATAGTEDIKAEDILDLDNTSLSNYDSNDFKLGSGNKMTFNINVKAGQTITIVLTGRSSSKNADKTEIIATHITCTASGAGVSETAVEKEFATGDATALEAITYTAASDGVVTFTINRKDGTSKLTNIAITVADVETGNETEPAA